jgi:protein-S-isoprenylcysteine O-methyltransferase Ste14
MALVLRHLLAILLLPFVVVVVVPAWLLTPRVGAPWADAPLSAGLVAGGAVFLCGLALFAWCVLLFARVGRGTLAPWDPTRALVAVGPYRHVRNPMISGVALMLLGEALLWGSGRLAAWAVAFVLVNHAYFVGLEEPGLEARFGEGYRAYRAAVPRWVPRLRPWTGA